VIPCALESRFDVMVRRGVAMPNPANDRQRHEDRISLEFVDRLVDEVTSGFRGDVGIVPRQFLRQFVDQMDLVDEHENYVPMTEYGFQPSESTPEEQLALSGMGAMVVDDDDAPVASEDTW